MRATLKERADAEAIRVFAENLRHLLLQPPLGGKRVLAIDPGFRTGCKVVALDEQGDLLEETVIYPHEPQKRAAEARQRSRRWPAATHRGRRGRQRHRRARDARARARDEAREAARGACVVVLVNESGASVYSASEIAREELPDTGHHRARRGVDRAAPAGSARRAGEDRPQVDRRRPVPARREPAALKNRSTRSSSRA